MGGIIMKRIEERAKEYASKKADISLSAVYNEALASIYEEAYIAGATEQIDMTIEERADAYVGHPEEIDEFTSETIKREAYIRGAKEQKSIDEEVRLKKSDSMTRAEYDREVAFADWYNKNGKGTPTYSDAIEWARKEVINKACELLKSVGVLTDDDSIMGFIKAMGE